MQVDPAPGLRHRVAGRLEAPARAMWGRPAFAVAAVLLAFVVAFALLRSPGAAPELEPRVATAPVSAPAVPPSAPRAAPPAERATAAGSQVHPKPGPQTSESIFGEPTGHVRATNLGADPSAVVPPPPVEPPPPDLVPLLTPITVAPITVTPIQIRPVTVDPIRNPK